MEIYNRSRRLAQGLAALSSLERLPTQFSHLVGVAIGIWQQNSKWYFLTN